MTSRNHPFFPLVAMKLSPRTYYFPSASDQARSGDTFLNPPSPTSDVVSNSDSKETSDADSISHSSSSSVSATLPLADRPSSSAAPLSSSIQPLSCPPPDLIILFGWMGAQPKHLAKYVQEYRANPLFSHSPIMVTFTDMPDLVFMPHWLVTRMRGFQKKGPVERMLKETVLRGGWITAGGDRRRGETARTATDTSTSGGMGAERHEVADTTAQGRESSGPRILMHLFSNGGAVTAVAFARAYREIVSKLPTPLPPLHSFSPSCSFQRPQPGHTSGLPVPLLVLDSSPGHPTVESALVALELALPPWISAFMKAPVMVLVKSVVLVSKWFRGPGNDMISDARRGLLDGDLFQVEGEWGLNLHDGMKKESEKMFEDDHQREGGEEGATNDRDRRNRERSWIKVQRGQGTDSPVATEAVSGYTSPSSSSHLSPEPASSPSLSPSSSLACPGTRVYIYSTADKLIDYEDVLAHAALSRAQGWDVVEVEFEKTQHVSHMRGDCNRYWGAVDEAWGRISEGKEMKVQGGRGRGGEMDATEVGGRIDRGGRHTGQAAVPAREFALSSEELTPAEKPYSGDLADARGLS